jgi:ribosome-associated protein
MIQITPSIALDERELQFEFIRASGPGGQKVNRTASAVQLRFKIPDSTSLPDDVKERLFRLGGKRISEDGVLIIHAKRFRSQEQNRQDAINRLVALLQKAAVPPKPRIRSKPSQASVERRLENKRRRSETKRSRRTLPPIDD